jgi:type IV fimbrial biogenesis protein FimT
MHDTNNKIPAIGGFGGARGFTMVELMTTVGVASVLVSIGLPSLTSFVMNNRITAQTNALLTDLAQARQESVKRRVPVVFAAASIGTVITFNQTNWSLGRAAYADANANATYDAGDTLVKVTQRMPSRLALSNADGITAIQYRPSGATNLLAGTRFTVCIAGYFGRDVVITPTGRAYTVTRTTKDCPGTPAS